MAIPTTFEEAVAEAPVTVGRLKQIVEGPEGEAVETPGGPVDTIRETQRKMQATVDAIAPDVMAAKAIIDQSVQVVLSQGNLFLSTADALNDSIPPVIAVGMGFTAPLVDGSIQAYKRTAVSPFYQAVGNPTANGALVAALDKRTAQVPSTDQSLSEFVVITPTIIGPNKARSASTGLEIDQAGYQYAGFDLTGTEIAIRASGYVNHGPVAFAVFADAAGVILEKQFPGGAGQVWDHVNQVLTPPAGARKVYISNNTVMTTPLKFEVRQIVGNVAPRLKAAETTVADVPAIKTSLSGFMPKAVTVQDGYYISKTSGAVLPSASFRCTQFAIAAGERVKVSTLLQGTSVALAVYYSDEACLNRIGIQIEGTATAVPYNDFELTVPAAARGVGVIGRMGTDIKIQTVGLVTDLVPRLEALENGATKVAYPLTLVGDSMISDSASGIAPELVAAYPTRTIYKEGIGGQDVQRISTRLGGWPLTLTVTGGSIPATGIVACVPSIDLLRRSTGVATCKVMVAGVLCGLTFESALNSGAGGYYLTPLVYLASAVAAAGSLEARVLSGWQSGVGSTLAASLGVLLGGTVIIRAGRNNSDPAESIAEVLAFVDGLVKQVQRYTPKWLVMGVTNGYGDKTTADGGTRPTAVSSYEYLTRIAAMNAAYRELYAGHYIDPLANLISLGYSADYTVNGATFKVLTDACLSDGTHENAVGKAATTALVKQFIDAKGW